MQGIKLSSFPSSKEPRSSVVGRALLSSLPSKFTSPSNKEPSISNACGTSKSFLSSLQRTWLSDVGSTWNCHHYQQARIQGAGLLLSLVHCGHPYQASARKHSLLQCHYPYQSRDLEHYFYCKLDLNCHHPHQGKSLLLQAGH